MYAHLYYMYLKLLYFIYFKISLLHTYISEITSFWPACCTTQFVSDCGRNPKDSFLMAHMSRVKRKPFFAHAKPKMQISFAVSSHTNSTILLLHKSETSSIYSYSTVLQSGLCQTWSETPKTGFLTTRLIS